MRTIIAAVALAAAGALVLSVPADAQPAATARTERALVIKSVTVGDMKEIMEDAGYRVEVERLKTGEVWLFGTERDGGFRLNVQLRVCDTPNNPPGCLGVLYQASYDLKAPEVPAARRAAAKFNETFLMAKSYLLDADTLVLEHYAITDGGVTRAHLAAVLDEFLGMPGQLLDLWEAEEAEPEDARAPI